MVNMKFHEIRFKFYKESIDENYLDEFFKRIENILNIQFDEKFNHYCTDNEIFYQFMDVSNQSSERIDEITNNFFNFTFDIIVDVPLYKFLVLKNNHELTVLAIIHSSIFNYTSIKKIYALFDNSNNLSFKNNIPYSLTDINDYLSSSDFEKDSDFWKEYLSDYNEYVKFYNLKSNNYKNIKIYFNDESINNFLEKNNIPKFNFITATFSLYLSRINRTPGCLLKTFVSENEDFERNTVLKIDYDESSSFDDYLGKIKNSYNLSVEHSKVDIDNYIEDCPFYYSINDFTDLNDIDIINSDESALTLNIFDDSLELIYNTDLFEEIYIKHMLMNIQSLISNVLIDSKQLCSDVSIVCDEDKNLIAKFCKSEKADVNNDRTLGLAVHENAINYPEVIAVDDGVEQITYSELDQITNSIAHDLLNKYDITHKTPVGLIVSRSNHFPTLVIALNKIGAVVIPIDPDYPTKRIEHMINIGKCENVIVSEEYAELYDFDIRTIFVNDLNFNNNVNVDIVSSGDDLFSIMFTSGTTGLPKGVKFANKQISGIATAYKNLFNIFAGEIIGCYASFSFVASYRMYFALYLGGSARIFNDDERKDNLLLIEALKEKPIAQVALPPSVGIPIFENEDLNIKYMVLTGAKINEFNNNKNNTQLVNNYGLTESPTVIAKIFDLNNNLKDVPLGKPVSNTWIYILDKNNKQVPVGVPGEICISSNYLSPGYMDNDELTNAKFIDNPYCDCEDNKRMFKTGDIGFYNFDGEIEFIGREDNQLSVRGFRIESGEILKVMKSFSQINEVVLDVDYDTLIAYYTTNAHLDIDGVKEALNVNLPYYMIPSLLVELDEIPLNFNGKIDKSALKNSFNESVDINIEDEVLSVVVDAFKNVLHRDSILIDDDFVALGGNSLSAMNLQMILKEKLGINLYSNEIIELSSPLNISNKIKFDLNVYSDYSVDYDFDDLCPFSESHLNVYLDEKVRDIGTGYNNPFKIQFNKDYSANDIRYAINKLFKIYPVLKARVLNKEDGLYFIFDSQPEIKEGELKDIDSFVQSFELDKNLSRFLIIESENILCFDCHHLIFDGTSINVLLDSLVSILNGDSPDYVDDGVLRQLSFEENMNPEYMNSAKDFFANMLVDKDETDELMPSTNPDDGMEYIHTFDIDKNYLDSFLQNHSITHNQFLSSAFGYTLSRFTGRSKVLFNLIENGRGYMDLSNSVGMFVKTLPILMDCTNQDISSFLKYSSSLINSIMKFDLYPFRVLANEYNLNSNITFQYAHDIFDRFNNDFLTAKSLREESIGDLNFFVYNRGKDSLEVKVLYSDKFSNDFIKRLVESFKLILDGMINTCELSKINYIDSSDLTVWDNYNDTEVELKYTDILDAFNDNLGKYLDNILVSGDNSYTHGEVAFIADMIAKTLIESGVGKQDCVSFVCKRSELYIINVLSILSIGGVPVPIDDALPDERIKFMMEDSNSKAIIVSENNYERVKNLSQKTIINISDIIENNNIGSLTHLPVEYGDLAGILYTSGTTGVPKGVKITRKSVLNLSAHYCDAQNLTNNDVYALYTSIGFDAGYKSIFKVLYTGAHLVIVPDDIKFNMSKLNNFFIENNVGHVFITTQVAKLFMQSIENTSLKVLSVGGEKLGKIESPTNYIVMDDYGPTEAFAFITSIDVDKKEDETSIGFLNYNSRAYILDDEFRQVPIGAVGELFLSGYQIADGYLNRDEETQKAFLDNPFDDNYDIMYRTGDMVRMLPDGSLSIVGRRDSQVKIRGNRVELLEIESTIREIDNVNDVTVQTIKHDSNNELVAYVVMEENYDENNLKDHICDYVAKYKPDFMIPSFVIKLDTIPLTINGKVNKHALPEVDFDVLSVEYVAPATDEERVIVEAFEKVFNRKKISINDDFLRLGGDSLTAIKLLTYLKDYNITIADILSLHTPKNIAKYIKEDTLDLDLYTLESGCPLNEPQLNVYLDIILHNKKNSYLTPFKMSLSKEYNLNEIKDALNKMLCIHPILEMCISEEFDIPHLVKGSKPQITIKDTADENFINEFLTKSFNLNESLSRFLIVENEDEYLLFAVFHHIIFDGLSGIIFKHDLQSILDGNTFKAEDSFLKVAAYSQQINDLPEYDDAETFYDNMLAEIDDVGILLDSTTYGSNGFSTMDLDLDYLLFKTFLEDNKVSENVLFTSVFAYTLSRFTGSNKTFFNIVENGRDRFNNFNSIGMYVNTLPLVINCENQDVHSFIGYISNMVYGVMKYNYYPFRILANKYDIDSDIIFQFMPDWMDDTQKISSATEDKIYYELLESMDDLIADLNVEVVQKGQNYNLIVVYSGRHSSDFVNHFMESYKLILHDMIKVDKLSDINYIKNDDSELLNNFNQTNHELMYDDILDAFNDNLGKYLDNVLVSGDNSYTHGEVAFIADMIAKTLIESGVGKQDCVSFVCKRSELYIINVLSILSIGGVPVPIDDALPDERIKFMMEDSNSKAIIVSENNYERVKNLSQKTIINISDIIENNNIGSLTHLPVEYGDLAGILYTSGTTGVPKGVKITRKSVLNLSAHYCDAQNLTNNDVYALYTSIGFDAGYKSIFKVLYTGAHLVIVPDDIKFNMSKLNNFFIENNVGHVFITTQVAKLFMQSIENTSLKVLSVGGEKLGKIESPTNYIVMDDYGPTEAFAFITSIDVDKKEDETSIGFLNYNSRAYILDDEFRQVPIGAVGELFLSGYQIADGYLNRDEETQKAFLDNPFDDNYDIMYRTGDMVRMLPDGSLSIVGRRDSQVKIRGNRVELLEIESTIREIDNVNDVTVQTIKHDSNNELVAYVVMEENYDENNLKDHICDYVAKYKPDFMIPSFVIKLDTIPLTINGKVNKHALPEVDFDVLSVEYVAPATDEERVIVEAFEKVFNRKKISINDDFLRLGGDSLTAIKLLTYLKDYNITIADILSLRTPKALSKNIIKNMFDLDLYTLESGCPLNEPQLNVYLDILAHNKNDSYLVPININLSKEYDLSEIEDALNEMLRVHPILEMCIRDEFDIPYLVKGSKPQITIKDTADENIINEFLTESFNLNESLSRFLIVKNKDKYVLFATFHHIIFDGLSHDIFNNDLQSILEGNTLDVDDSFLKIAAYSQQINELPKYDDAETFYDNMLTEIDEVGVLLDSVTSDGNGVSSIDLNLDYHLFKAFLEDNEVSENVMFTSVFAYALSRFVGNDKVLFNIVENGRDKINNINSIGMYVNTLPLLIDCKNQDIPSFIEYMSNMIYGVMKHNYYPFRLLAKKYDIDSSIMFQFMPDWTKGKEEIESPLEDSLYHDLLKSMDELIADLSVGVIQKGQNYNLRIVYSEKYSRDFINNFMESYKLILHDIIKVNELRDINYITYEDIEFLDKLNQTEHELEYNNVLDAFNDNLSKYPLNQLVSYKDISYTYSEGAFIADKLAKQLIKLNISKGDCVSFLTERNENYVLCPLGIMSIGATYVPLDDTHPDERIKYIINDTSSKVVIVSDETLIRAKNIVDDHIILLNINTLFDNDLDSLTKLPVVYGDIACVLYTSGTTGVPKGVKVTSKSIVNLVTMYKDKYNIDNSDIYGLFSSIGFDAALLAIMVVLYSGASLSILPEDIRLDINKMNEYFIEQKVTHTLITSQVGKIFMEQVKKTSLKVLFVGGEQLGEIEDPEDYMLVDAFGPTENTVFVCSIQNSKKIDYSSVGSSVYNTKFYVLDKELRRVPVGVVGELFVSGLQVADGYLNREEETINSFLDNPFDDEEEYNILYRSGDMVRILPDGSLGYVGRSDSQVKIRGNRVELSEVDTTIRELNYIEDVTVQTIKNGSNNELVAYVTCSKKWDDEYLSKKICNHIRSNKPEFMVPSHIIRLDRIPLNINGKVDKRALPKVDKSLLSLEYVAPTNTTEKAIVEAFECVFNQNSIGILDDFVHLGGDSLTAIKLLTYLKDYNITVAEILSLRTPKSIAENMKDNLFDLDLYNLESGCPLNESQLNVYLDIMTHNKKNSYLIQFRMGISKEYDLHTIENALNEMLHVHPILEMRVSDEFDVPYLVKGPKPQIIIKDTIDEKFIGEFLTKSFDFNGTLSKYLIVETDEEYVLFALFHHIIFDGLSYDVFKHDMLSILDGDTLEVDDSFLKVATYTQQIRDNEDYDAAENYYDNMLVEIDEVGILLDSVTSDGNGVSSIDLNLDYSLLKSFLKNNEVSESIVFTSVFAYTLSRFAGSNKILFNIVENGRDRFNNFNSIGMYVNTLPLLIDCKNQDINSFIDYMSHMIYGVMKYNYYPFRLLAKKYGINSSILFQFLPDWIKDPSDITSTKEYDDYILLDSQIGDFTAVVNQIGKNYNLNITYSRKYSSDFVNNFMEAYKFILHDMIKVDNLSDINYIANDDVEFLNNLNHTEHKLKYGDILDAFNDNLMKYPDNKLVSMNENYYSYGEGAFIANKLAKQLINLDVDKGDCVSFLVERSELYMFCSLGILSVGGVYVPLDDNLPDERIKFILKDTDSSVVIVSDKTYERAKSLVKDAAILNISDILKENLGILEQLPVVYDDIACILYTSGTTGLPKGVKVTRKSILNISAVYVDKFNFDRNDSYGMFANISFDAGSWAISQTIYAGACLTIVPDNIKLDMVELNKYFIDHDVTHTMITTQVGKLFMENVKETSLDVLMVGGEKLGDFKSPEDYLLIDGFGPTETFGFISSIKNSDKIDSSSIGEINYNTKVYVLDDEFRPVPVGAVGELYVSGYQVAQCYLNREEANIKAFIENPFDSNEDYRILYRTGDMVRILYDGSLAIVGRGDNQIKIRGNRVELSEIESTIRKIDNVYDVTVQTIKHDSNNELVAYVVSDIDENDLRNVVCEYIFQSKPDYMIPSYVMKLDAIPLTVNGKVDKRALPEVDLDILRADYVAPTNEIEKELIEAFEKVFDKEKISIHDDFFKLGGDSLTAIKIKSRLTKDIDATTILKARTPYRIAQNNTEYGFELFKKGIKNQNMFILPSQVGLSFELLTLANNLDFEGNIYLIDDFKYDLSLDEIKESDDCNLTLNHYYDAIKDNFQDNDIIVGYSLGCIFASLIAEKLEKNKNISNCILIDGPLEFVKHDKLSKEDMVDNMKLFYDKSDNIKEKYSNEYKDKYIEITVINSHWNFNTPHIHSHITYLTTTNSFKEELENISDNHEFIHIDSTHEDIIKKDVDKIIKYFK